MSAKVAIVTGANKGIGYAAVQALCKQLAGDDIVFLTGRSEERCKEAVAKLQGEGLSPKYHTLDLDDEATIKKFRDFIKDNYGGIDVLINNAGMAYKGDSPAPFGEQAEVTCNTNYFGTLKVCDALFPLLRKHARVSNVSSFVSQMAMSKCSSDVQAKFTKPDITMNQLSELMQQFITASKDGKHQEKGFANTAYGMSKVGVSVMSFIQQRQFDKDRKDDDIIVNACCPGWVDTDMSSHKGPKTIQEGADTPVYVALLPPGTKSPRGQFVKDRQIKNWPK